MKVSLLIILLFAWPYAAHGEVFKWVDEQGNTHYGDKPNDDQSSTQLEITEPESKKPVPEKEDRDERRRRLADVLQEDRLKKVEEKNKVLVEKEQLNKKCAYAKDQLKQYEDSDFLYNLDKDGNRIRMSDEYKTSTIDNLRSQISKNCMK